MSKLDEMEKNLDDNLAYDAWGLDPEDVRLLIRAVRQLGNLDVHLMGRAKALKEGLLDPDVLELINGS